MSENAVVDFRVIILGPLRFRLIGTLERLFDPIDDVIQSLCTAQRCIDLQTQTCRCPHARALGVV